MRITRSRTALSQGSNPSSVQESTTSSAHDRARRREPERRGRVRRGGEGLGRAQDGLRGLERGGSTGGAAGEGVRALLGPLPIVEPRRDDLEVTTVGKTGNQQFQSGPTTSMHIWATIPVDEHMDPQEEAVRCAKETALVQQIALAGHERDQVARGAEDGGDGSRWIVDRGPEVWYLDPLVHAELARTWRIARAPPLGSALDLSVLAAQTPAERVPVGRNLADWVFGPSFPALPPDVLPTTLRLPALPSPLALIPAIPSPQSGSGSKSDPRSLLRAATAPHPSPSSYPHSQSQGTHTPDLAASLMVGATTHQTISPAARAVLPPGKLREWAARRRVERAIIARSEVRDYEAAVAREDWTSEDLKPWEWEPRRGRGIRAAPGEAPHGTAGGTSTWAEGITSILPSRSLPGTSPPPLAPLLDARGRSLAPIPRAPLALSSSTAALLAKRKAPAALQETRGRGKKRERGNLKVKEQHAAVEGGRAMEVLRGRLPTFRLSNGSADGQPEMAEDEQQAAGSSERGAVLAKAVGPAITIDATIVFNSPQAESTQIAEQRNAAGPTAGDASAWRNLQLTPAEDDSIHSIGQEDIGGAADLLDADEAEAAVDEAQDVPPVPLDPAGQRRASMRRAMRKDKTYQSIMDVFPELASPVPPPRTRSGQRKARQHIAKAAAIDPPAVAHPLHPDLGALEEAVPYTRVCWYIPVHGPAYIPNLPDSHQPASARVHAVPNQDDIANSLLWTEADLLECWILLKRMQELQRFGPMRLVVSPPSPDPYRPAPAPLPPRHCHVAPEPLDDPPSRPQRLEIGTHIRLYCDLEWARRVRTALSVLPFPAKADEGSARRLLHGVRLALVGDMGEVLTVI